MDIFISADVEGVAGVVNWDQVMPGGDDYEVGWALMAGEVNAAIDGAFSAGADRVVVDDAHSRMTNLLPEAVDQRAHLVLGHYKPLDLLQGLDANFDAMFLVGCHGAIGEPDAVLSHTYNPRAIREVKVDGRSVSEIGINALVCDYFGIPIRLVTGDRATVREARDIGAAAHVAEVKRSSGRYSAENMSPTEARNVIRHQAATCLQALPLKQPVRRSVLVEKTVLVADMVSIAGWIEGVERTDARSVSFSANDDMEAYQVLLAIMALIRSVAE